MHVFPETVHCIRFVFAVLLRHGDTATGRNRKREGEREDLENGGEGWMTEIEVLDADPQEKKKKNRRIALQLNLFQQ